MRSVALAALLVLLPAGGCAAQGTTASPTAPDPTTDEQKTLYALGLVISRNLGPFNLTPEELAFVQAGISDGVQGQPSKADLPTFGPKIQEMAHARATAAAAIERQAGESFLAAAAAEPGAIKTASGVIYQEITAGTGESPQATGKVRVQYTGRLRDGKVFDSSVQRGQPAELTVNAVLPCWTEGLLKMKVGGKSKLTCPATSAYGDRGSPPDIKPGAPISLEVELLEIIK
jgi:FKBP-type peptidyl-prolyl cis-trans isomerase